MIIIMMMIMSMMIITLLSPETAKHLQVPMIMEIIIFIIKITMMIIMIVKGPHSFCTGPGSVEDLGHELYEVHRGSREGDHQD